MKVILCILLMVLITTLQWSFGLYRPEIASELALEQLRNPSIENDSTQRALNSFDVGIIIWGAYLLFVLVLFKGELKNAFSNFTK